MPFRSPELIKKYVDALIAWAGVFAGSLLWDLWFGDGIQRDDYHEAFSVACLATGIHLLIAHLRRDSRDSNS